MEALGGLLEKLPEILVAFGSLGTVGWIAAGVLLLVIGVGGFFYWRWWQGQKVEQARKDTAKDREQAHQDTIERGKEWEKDLGKDQDAIRKRKPTL